MAAAARIPLHRALAAHVRGALAAPPRRAGPTALSGASLLAALVYASSSETASCDGAAAPPTAPLRPLPGSGADESQSRRQLREALDSGYLAGITVRGSGRRRGVWQGARGRGARSVGRAVTWRPRGWYKLRGPLAPPCHQQPR